VILDTNGNIFGGFTPVKWESRDWHKDRCYISDPTSISFIFTLKNPHNISAQRFALSGSAIWCNSQWGPHFGDIGISNNCNSNTYSYGYFDKSRDNYIQQDGLTFFANSKNFRVKEIEVFTAPLEDFHLVLVSKPCHRKIKELQRSMIIPNLSATFPEFCGKKFVLLWRGSRDGFCADNFHRRCDWHSNTLTVILDMKGNIFGGFTPLKWESASYQMTDPSLKSFLFTVKNPHNVPARRFALAHRYENAIDCYARRGPSFWDIWVSENCNANTDSSTGFFGNSYTNDTGLEGSTFFTGSPKFQVKEIEVFKITA
jgi:hypothetical protein